jgi:hypothetical protein
LEDKPLCKIPTPKQKRSNLWKSIASTKPLPLDSSTIPIVGLSTEMMQDLEDKFLTIEGIGDIVRCYQTETIGRWNIPTKKTSTKFSKKLNRIYNHGLTTHFKGSTTGQTIFQKLESPHEWRMTIVPWEIVHTFLQAL